MVTISQRHHRFDAKIRIPKELQDEYGGKQQLEKRLASRDLRAAKAEGQLWEASLRIKWRLRADDPSLTKAQLREEYERQLVNAGSHEGLNYYGENDPVVGGIDFQIDKLAEEVGRDEELSPLQGVKLAALQDARKAAKGLPVAPRPELEPSFSETAERFMKWWKTQKGLKQGNTEQQKRATYRLFAGYWRDRPIRGVRDQHASGFMDTLRHFDPLYARSPAARQMEWDQLHKQFGDCERGLSPSTLNRHVAALKALWDWSARRGLCQGLNPFDGHSQRLRRGVNSMGYEPWSSDELRKLLEPGPKRHELHEVMLVAMHSGMRLNEIAALTWDDLKEGHGVHYFDVTDAKTLAGIREVPVHAALGWLLKRPKRHPSERIWSTFNPEGPGKKPGADASREFSSFKMALGFGSRTKAFHSFRKNVVGQWEQLGVHQTQVAQIVGHEKEGITYRAYGPGVLLQRKAEIIEMISYAGLNVCPPT